MRNFYQNAMVAALTLLLAACGGGEAARPPLTVEKPAAETRQIALLVKWQADVGEMTPLLEPTLTNGGSRVCAVSREGGVSFLNVESGEHEYEPVHLPPADGDYVAGAGCAGDIIAAASEDGWLRVHHATEGLLWEKNIKTRVFGAPLLAGGRLLVLGLDGKLLAYTLRQGRELWRYISPLKVHLRTVLDSSPVLAGNTAYIGIGGGVLVAINVDNGRVQWEDTVSVPTSRNAIANIMDVTTPVLSSGAVCATAYQGGVACFRRRSGGRLWQYPLAAGSRAAVDAVGGRVFASDLDGSLYAFNAADGALLWRNDTGLALSAPLFVGGMVLVGDDGGRLYAFFADNGNLGTMINLSGDKITHLRMLPQHPDGLLALSQDGELARLQIIR